MNDIREIVTKAVIGKGKKRFKITSPLNDLRSPADSILGCWIINHKFMGTNNQNEVNIKGSFDVNVWYSYEKTCTDDYKVCSPAYKEFLEKFLKGVQWPMVEDEMYRREWTKDY